LAKIREKVAKRRKERSSPTRRDPACSICKAGGKVKGRERERNGVQPGIANVFLLYNPQRWKAVLKSKSKKQGKKKGRGEKKEGGARHFTL